MSLNKKRIFIFAVFLVSLLFLRVASADTLGQKVNFFVDSDFDKFGRTSLTATLRHAGQHIYFYVEDSYWDRLDISKQNSLSNNMSTLVDEFDGNIYPKETVFWGSEPNPGIDGDPKITILLQDMIQNTGGYFDTANGFSSQRVSDSNQREMIFISAGALLLNLDIVKTFIAHEFQHLISFNQKEITYNLSEDVWLNELRSEYSTSLVGYNDIYPDSNLQKRVSVFLDNSSNSLAEWPNQTSDYGIAAVLGEYFVEQFGKTFLAETLRSPYVGMDSFERYLRSQGRFERFADIFLNWMAAVYLNDVSIDNRWGYQRAELKNIRVTPQQRVFLSNSLSYYSLFQTLKDWQPAWLEFDLSSFSGDLSKSAKIDIGAELDQNFPVAYMAFYNQGPPQMGRINISAGKGSAIILNPDRGLNKVVLLATKGTKASRFSTSEQVHPLSVQISLIETKEAEASIIKDGVLIRKRGEPEIYVIWGKYKRYLLPGVIALYGHLNPANAIEIEPEVFHSYTTSNYVKYVNDEKVYALWPDGTRHWLNITPQQWDASSRDWGAIFTINDLELNYYRIGTDITR